MSKWLKPEFRIPALWSVVTEIVLAKLGDGTENRTMHQVFGT